VPKAKKKSSASQIAEAAKAYQAMRDAQQSMQPWDVPIGGGPEPIQPQPFAGIAPSPAPTTPALEDPFAQAQKLEQQRDVWKNLIPEGWWNK
jgi:hypothetical protein